MASVEEPVKGRCPWCDLYKTSTVGLCFCTEACGVITCPQRNADDYVPPPVPIFRKKSNVQAD